MLSTADAAVDSMAQAYAGAMRRYVKIGELETWYDRITVEMNLNQLDDSDAERIGKVIARGAQKRSRSAAAKKLTTVVDGHRRITDDPPAAHAFHARRGGRSERL